MARMLTVRLDDKAAQALGVLMQGGRSQSVAVRDALLLAAGLAPIVDRLDRIEARLAAGPAAAAVSDTTSAPDPDTAASPAILDRVAADLLGAFGGQDE